MGPPPAQEDCSPLDSHKDVRFSEKVETVGTPKPHGPTPRPSYVSGEEVLPDEHTIQPHAPTAKCVTTIDEDPCWARQAILSLDGGGVRGYSSLLILQELMGIVANHELTADPNATSSLYSPLVRGLEDKGLPPMSSDIKLTSRYWPCHYFDYVSGTSTGSLIAIILGRLRWNIDDCIVEYERLSAMVFQKPSWLKRSSTNYNEDAKWGHLKNEFDLLRPMWPSPSESKKYPVLFKSDPVRCRTIVCSMESILYDDSKKTELLFRSYHQPRPPIPELDRFARNPSTPDTFAIWQVARATSAAPFYSKPFRLNTHQYYDAAAKINNPSEEVFNEVVLLARGHLPAIGVLLSIGGGNAKVSNLKSKFGDGSLEKDLAHASDAVHQRLRSRSVDRFEYFRLEVKEGLQNVHLNEWNPAWSGETTLRKIRKATAKYLQKPEVRSQLEECAKSLVNKRVERAETMRWEYWATGTQYKCPKENCRHPEWRFPDRNLLLDHLRKHHNCPPPDAAHFCKVEMLLDRGRMNEE